MKRSITYFKLFILIATLFWLASCITQNRRARICATCPVKEETKIKDSVWSKQTVKKDTIYLSVPGPTIYLPHPCAHLCDSAGKLKKFSQEGKSNGIKSKLYTDTVHDKLVQECDADSLQAVINQITIENNHLRETNKIITLPPVKVNELTKWQSFLIVSSYIFWIIVILYFGVKYIRKFILKK